MASCPSAVAFDVAETLMPLEPLAARFERAGLTTGWLGRLEGRYGSLFAPADVTGAELAEVAEGLLALPARS